MQTIPLEITDSNFEEVIQNDQPVLVDFWAIWCGPCQMLAPIIEDLASEYRGKAVIGKVNIDNNPHVSAKYNIRSIPTLMIFKQGELVDKIVGAVSKSEITKKLETHC